MKKTLLVLITFLLLGTTAFASGTAAFSDVKETDWFAEAVSEAVSLGLINGKGDNRFDPDGAITLAEAVKLASCMNQLRTEGAVTLTNGDPWYETYAGYGKSRFLTEAGVGFSYENVMSSPNKIINRAEFAWLFAHAVTDLPEVNAIPDNAIPDVVKDAEPCYSEIYTLYRAGIINGSDENGSFHPSSNIKRSEVAAIVVRMMKPEKRVGPPAVPVFPDDYCGSWVSRYGNALTITRRADGMCAFTLVEGSKTFEGVLGVFELFPNDIDTAWSLLTADGTPFADNFRITCEDGTIRLKADIGQEFFDR